MDPIKEYYESIKGAGFFVDEADFRDQLSKSPKDVFQTMTDVFVDFDDFETSLGLKKKDGGQASAAPQLDLQLGAPKENPALPPTSELLKRRKQLVAEKETVKPIAAPGFVPTPQVDYDKQIGEIDDQIKQKGFKPEEIVKDFSDLDIEETDDYFNTYKQTKQTKPISAMKDIADRTWGSTLRSLVPPERQEEVNVLAREVKSLPLDINQAFEIASRGYDKILELTGNSGEAREKAIKAYEKSLMPTLGEILLRDRSGSMTGKDLPIQLELMRERIFNRDRAPKTEELLATDFTDPDAKAAKQRKLYDMETRGLGIISNGIGLTFENSGITDFNSWLELNKDRYDALYKKSKEAKDDIKPVLRQYGEQKKALDNTLNDPAYKQIKDQEEQIRMAEKAYEEATEDQKSRMYDLYAGEVDKYKIMADAAPDVKEKVDAVNKTVEQIKSMGLSKKEVSELESLYSEYNKQASAAGPLSDQLNNWANFVDKRRAALYNKYPAVLEDEVKKAEQEFSGQKEGAFRRLDRGFVDLISNTGSMASQLFRNILGGDIEADYRDLGRSQAKQAGAGYTTAENQLYQSPYITVIPDNIREELSSVDSESKRMEIIKKGFQSGAIYQTTNPNSGDFNLTAGSVVNTMATVMPQILGAAGLTAASGGGTGMLFVTTAMQAFSPYYNEAVEKGIANPIQYATAHTLVDAVTETFDTTDLKLIKGAMAGKTGFGATFFKDLTQGEFDKLLAGSKKAFKNYAKAAGPGIASNITEAGEEYIASIGGDVVNKYVFGENPDIGSEAVKEFVTTSIGTLPLTAFSIPSSVMKADAGKKISLYNAAADLNNTLNSLKDQLENGAISQKEYADRVKLITEYSAIVRNMPKVYENGNPMRDADKVIFAFNQFIASRKKDGTIPPAQEAKIDEVINNAALENDRILAGQEVDPRIAELNRKRQEEQDAITAEYEALPEEQRMEGALDRIDRRVEIDQRYDNEIQKLRDATKESAITEGPAGGDIIQPQGAVQGQQGQGEGQATQPQANVGDSDQRGQGQITPEQVEVSNDPKDFSAQVTSAKESLGDAGLSVSPYEQDDYDKIASEGGQFLRAAGNKVLALLKPNGEMVSLVKDKSVEAKGAAQAMISKMKDLGGLFMDNYDIYLTKIYEKAGYKVAARVPFNEAYAPEGWNSPNSPLNTKPDVVFMVRNDIPTGEAQTFTDYDEAQSFVKGIVDKSVADGIVSLPSPQAAPQAAPEMTPQQSMEAELRADLAAPEINTALESLRAAGITARVVPAAEFEAIAGRTGEGMFLADNGEVVFNEDIMGGDFAQRVVWHEFTHPVINTIRNTDRPLYDRIVRGFTAFAEKNAAAKAAKDWAEANNDDPSVIEDEFVTETIASVADGTIDLTDTPSDFKIAIYDLLNKIAKILGFDEIKNMDEAKALSMAKKIANALTTGQDIREVVGDQLDYGRNLGEPTQLSAGDVSGRTVDFKDSYPLSFVKPEDKIDIKALIKDIADKGQKVWFWVADQLGRGMYYDKVVDGEHYLDAGPSFALDPENRNENVIWATGKGEKFVNDNIAKSDYLFIISGSPIKSKLFNKRVSELTFNRVKKAVGEEGAWDKFKSEMLAVSKIGDVNKILDKYNSFEELLASPDRKQLLIAIDAQKDKKGTPLKALLEKYDAFIDYNNLRDGFYRDNDFELNDIMLVLKPTGYGGKSKHSTYENDILGEVVGVPDAKINAFDIMPEDFKAKYRPDMSRTEQSQAVAPYGSGIRQVQTPETPDFSTGKFEPIEKRNQMSVGGRATTKDITGKIGKSLIDDGEGNYVFLHYSPNSFRKVDPRRFGSTLFTSRNERPGVGLSMFYVKSDDVESGLRWDYAYLTKIPKGKVYPFNEDPLGLIEVARKEFRKQYGDQIAFDPNKQVGFLTKVAADRGFLITVAKWNSKGKETFRAQTTEKLPVEYFMKSEGLWGHVKMNPKYKDMQLSVGNRIAPNGRPSNLNAKQYQQVRTPEFKAWFGDWETNPESASKAVDENGEPLVLFHGTKAKFDQFEYNKMSWESRLSQQGPGFYMTDNKKAASQYGKPMNVFANVKNPLVVDGRSNNITKDQAYQLFSNGDNNWFYESYLPFYTKSEGLSKEELIKKYVDDMSGVRGFDKEVLQNIKRSYNQETSYDKMMSDVAGILGKDGVIEKVSDGLSVYVAFTPNQIKSATENIGTFSTEDDRIQMSAGQRPQFSREFKLAAFVMRKKAEGETNEDIKASIQSVSPVENIDELIDNPEQFLRNAFPDMTELQKDNIVELAKIQNVYRGRKFGKPTEFTGLQVPQEVVDEYLKRNKVRDITVREKYDQFADKWLSAAKGLPRWTLELKALSSGAKNIEIARAEKTINRLRDEAKRIGFTNWKAFSKALSAVQKIQDPILSAETGLALFDPLRASEGKVNELAPELIPPEIAALPDEIIPYVYRMRGQIDALTKDLVGMGFVSPEQAVILEKNIGQYVNRSYKLYSQRNYKPDEKAYNEAVKYLTDVKLAQLVKDRVTDDMIGDEDAIREITREAANEAMELAKRDVQDILAKKPNPYIGKDDSRNLDILKQRKDIPEPIRKLMGQNEDPGVNFMMTVAKQAALKSSSMYLAELRRLGMGTIFFEKDDPRRPAGTIELPTGETKKPIDGLYTFPEIEEALNSGDPTYNNLTQAWMKAVGFVRWGKTVGSIVTQFKNFESNLGFAVMNGLLMTGSATDAFKESAKYVKGQYSKDEISAITEKAIKLDLVGQSVGLRELKEMMGSGDVHDIALDIALSPDGVFRKRSKYNVFAQANKLYRMGDDFWKVYAYLNERQLRSKAMFEKDYSALTPEEEQQVDKVSAEIVKDTWPTYDRVVEAAKFLSKRAPIFGNFISFQAESARVLANTIRIARRDLKDPATKALGVRRMVGIASYFAFRTAATLAAAKIAGIAGSGVIGMLAADDDEEAKKRALKSVIPPFMRTEDILPIQGQEKHKYTVYSMSSIDPYALIPNSLNAFTDGREGIFGDMEPGVTAALFELFSPFAEPEMTYKTVSDVLQNKDPKTGDKLIKSSKDIGDAIGKVGGAIWNTLEPSTIGLAQRLYERDNKWAELSSMAGARPYDIDLHDAFTRKLSLMGKNMEDISREYFSVKLNKKSTPEEVKQAELDAENSKAYEIQRMNQLYRDLIKLGANPDVLNEIIEKKSPVKVSGFDKTTKSGIKTGKVSTKKLYK